MTVARQAAVADQPVVEYACPYDSAACIWPKCRRTIEGWHQYPDCRQAERRAECELLNRVVFRSKDRPRNGWCDD